MVPVAIGSKSGAQVESRFSTGDEVQDEGARDGPQHLGDDIRNQVGSPETTAGPETDGDRGVEMATGDMANGIGHGEDGETEGKGDPQEPDPHAGESRCQDGAPASPKD